MINNLSENKSYDEIRAIPPSALTAVFTPDQNQKFPRLEQSLAPIVSKLYKAKIKKLSPSGKSFEEGVMSVPLKDFFEYNKASTIVLDSSMSKTEIITKLDTLFERTPNLTYAIIRVKPPIREQETGIQEQETGNIALCVGGSGAHAISSMDARIADFWRTETKQIFTEDEIKAFEDARTLRFEVLAAGDIYKEDGIELKINNQSGAYPDAFLDSEENIEQGRENTIRALEVFDLHGYFEPFTVPRRLSL